MCQKARKNTVSESFNGTEHIVSIKKPGDMERRLQFLCARKYKPFLAGCQHGVRILIEPKWLFRETSGIQYIYKTGIEIVAAQTNSGFFYIYI